MAQWTIHLLEIDLFVDKFLSQESIYLGIDKVLSTLLCLSIEDIKIEECSCCNITTIYPTQALQNKINTANGTMLAGTNSHFALIL